jgi:TetR/AcrR family transcriptional repressor of bet genes
LIEATVRAIAAHGYTKLTLTDVAGEAGLSPAIVNFYFKSKDQLLVATLEHLGAEYDAFWHAAVAAAGGSPAAALEAMIEADFDPRVFAMEKVKVWFAFWAEAQIQPAYRDLVSRMEAGYYKETHEHCARLIEQGGYRVDPVAVAYGLNAMIDGLWFDYLIDPEAFDVELAKRSCRLFLAGLFPREFGRADGAIAPVEEAGDVRSQTGHRARLAAALKRRLHPNTPMQPRDLAAAIGVTAETVRNWLAEASEPSSGMMGRLAGALDAQIWIEIYGPAFQALRERFEARLAAAREADALERAALEALGQSRP